MSHSSSVQMPLVQPGIKLGVQQRAFASASLRNLWHSLLRDSSEHSREQFLAAEATNAAQRFAGLKDLEQEVELRIASAASTERPLVRGENRLKLGLVTLAGSDGLLWGRGAVQSTRAANLQATEQKAPFEYWVEPRAGGSEFFRRHLQDRSPSQSLLNTEELAAQAGCLVSVGEVWQL